LLERPDDTFFMFSSFLKLLEYEGLGPPTAISHNSILSYYSSRHFIANVETLINRVMSSNAASIKTLWSAILPINLCYEPTKLWGRTGFTLNKLENWRPTIFIGFLINGEDHFTIPLLQDQSPDFCFIISFHNDYHGKYAQLPEYKQLRDSLENNPLLEDWDVYNHIEDEGAVVKNYWHPIHVRKPMLELFRGTKSSEEQESILTNAINDILPIIIGSNEFNRLQNKLKITIG